MRHVGRFDPETKLPITEVTQAEFDDLPQPGRPVPGMWREHVFLRYWSGGRGVGRRHLVIVEDNSPRVPYPNSSPGSSSRAGSLALVSDA